MNSPFSFSKYSGVAAAATWTLGWVLVAGLVVLHIAASGGIAANLGLPVAVIGIVFGSFMAFRFFPRQPDSNDKSPSPPEPWHHRAMGSFAATVWCAVGLGWNLAVFGTLARSAINGQNLNFVILMPFSLIGLFLLLLVFVSITLVLDFLFRLADATFSSPTGSATGSTVTLSPATVQQASQSATQPLPQANATDSKSVLKKSPVLGTLTLLSFINWFVFAGVSLYLGGDAVGTIPPRDGFILTSHGRHTAVSESLWVFSLFYGASTLLLTPAIWLLFAVRTLGGKFKAARRPMKIFIFIFLLVWCVGWFSGIGRSMCRSIHDWQELKHNGGRMEFSPQMPSHAAIPRDGATDSPCMFCRWHSVLPGEKPAARRLP